MRKTKLILQHLNAHLTRLTYTIITPKNKRKKKPKQNYYISAVATNL